MRNDGAAHKNIEAPRSFDSASRASSFRAKSRNLSCTPVSNKYEIAEKRSTKTLFMKWHKLADSRVAIEISRLRSK